MEALGARPTPGIGFGSGIERMILNLDRQGLEVAEDSARPVVIVHRGAEGLDHGLGLAAELRSAGHPALVAPTGKSMRAQMRYASATAARFTLVIGEDELANGTVSVRDMDNGTQETVQGAGLSDYLQARP
jgi:histidyl-tRNA synthetase